MADEGRAETCESDAQVAFAAWIREGLGMGRRYVSERSYLLGANGNHHRHLKSGWH